MGVLLPLRFAQRDQNDNFYLQALNSKIDINKLGLRIDNTCYTAWDIFVFLEKQIETRGIAVDLNRNTQ